MLEIEPGLGADPRGLYRETGVEPDRAEEVLGELGDVHEIGKRDFRLDHPKFGEVSTRVRVFCAKSWTEGVDAAHRQTIRLDLQLS